MFSLLLGLGIVAWSVYGITCSTREGKLDTVIWLLIWLFGVLIVGATLAGYPIVRYPHWE